LKFFVNFIFLYFFFLADSVNLSCSFPALSCEFASVDVSDVLGTVSFYFITLFSYLFYTNFLYAILSLVPRCFGISPSFLTSYLQNRLNITKTVRKFSIDSKLRPTGSEFHSGTIANAVKHDDEVDTDFVEGSLPLTSQHFDKYVQL